MALVHPRPEAGRIYTHVVERMYIYSKKEKREKQFRRIYIESMDMLARYDATEDDVMYSSFEFTINPLLTTRFWEGLSLSDRLKIIKPAIPRNLWLLAIIEGIEFTSAAAKPCNAGTELIEITGRTVIQKKLEDLYTRRYALGDETSVYGQDRCIVVNDDDDRVPSLPVYPVSDERLVDFLRHTRRPTPPSIPLAPVDVSAPPVPASGVAPTKEVVPPVVTVARSVIVSNDPMTWRSISKKGRYFAPEFSNTWHWKDDTYIVPYCLVHRVVYDDVEQIQQQKQATPTEPSSGKNGNGKRASRPRNALTSNTRRKKKGVILIQVVVVYPKAEYNSLFGTPISIGQGPCTFHIGADAESSKEYHDSFESFYISNPNLSALFDSLHQPNLLMMGQIHEQIIPETDLPVAVLPIQKNMGRRGKGAAITTLKEKNKAPPKKRRRVPDANVSSEEGDTKPQARKRQSK